MEELPEVAMLRMIGAAERDRVGETGPERITLFPGFMHAHKLSLLDGAVLWTITAHTAKYGFCGLTYNMIADSFNVSRLTIPNSIKTLTEISRPFEIIKEVHPTKEQKMEYLQKLHTLDSKSIEKGILRAKCFRITNEWIAYVKSGAANSA